MGVILFIALLVYIILYYDLKSDYKKLKAKYEQLKKNDSSVALEKNNTQVQEKKESEVIQEEKPVITEEPKIQETPKKSKQEDKSSNKLNWLFGIGMALICLTYFALVNTTWDVISNGAKAFVVLLFSGIFFGASIVLEKALKTTKANIVFWLLGVIYLPFALIAIFAYGLFGNYLSFAGEGSAICLTMVAFSSLILNLISAAKYKNPVFVWIYMISEFLVIAFATKIFTPDNDILLLVLAVYTGVVMLLVEVIKKVENYDYVYVQYNIYKQIVLWVMNSVIVLRTLSVFELELPLIIAMIILVCIDLYESYKSNKEEFGISGLILAILALTSIYRILGGEIKLPEIQLIGTLFTTIILVLAMIFNKYKDSVLHKSMCYFGYAFVGISSILSLGLVEQDGILPIFIIGLNIIGIICAGLISKNHVFGFALPILILLETAFILTKCIPTISEDLINYIVLGVSTILYVCTCLFSKNKYVSLFKWGTIVLVPSITFLQFISMQIKAPTELFVFNQSIIFIFVTYLMLAFGSWKIVVKEYREIVKYAICMLAYIMFVVILNHFVSSILSYTIAGVMMFGMDVFARWKFGKSMLPISIISNLAMLIGLFTALNNGETYMLWFYILALAYYVYNAIMYNYIESLKTVFKIAYFAMIYIVTATIFDVLYEIGLTYWFKAEILVTTLIITVLYLIEKKEDITTTIVLFILNLMTVGALSNISITGEKSLIIELLPSLTFIGLMATQSVLLNPKAKDVYKAIIALTALVPYNIILGHYELVPAGLNAIIYIADLYIVTRLIWKKYWKEPKNIEVLENIALVIIYLTTMIQSFAGFNQCIVLDLILAIVILIGFIKQENSMFVTTAISFIVIVFAQTASVDFPIEWLIILLLFGIGFIGFAAYNEVKKRKQIESNK